MHGASRGTFGLLVAVVWFLFSKNYCPDFILLTQFMQHNNLRWGRTAALLSRAINHSRKHASYLHIVHVTRVRNRALARQTATSHRQIRTPGRSSCLGGLMRRHTHFGTLRLPTHATTNNIANKVVFSEWSFPVSLTHLWSLRPLELGVGAWLELHSFVGFHQLAPHRRLTEDFFEMLWMWGTKVYSLSGVTSTNLGLGLWRRRVLLAMRVVNLPHLRRRKSIRTCRRWGPFSWRFFIFRRCCKQELLSPNFIEIFW